MSASTSRGPISHIPSGNRLPSRTSGPLGHNDAADPTRNALLGDTPGVLGVNDHAMLVASSGNPVPPHEAARSPLAFNVEHVQLTRAPGQLSWDILSKRFTFRFLHLIKMSKVTVGAGVGARGKVTVGFIQNVLSRSMTCTYTGAGGKKTWKADGALLDAIDGRTAPWYIGQEPFTESFAYEAGNSATIFFSDTPGASYWNYYGNDEKKGELIEVRETMDFALWLAARETADDATNWQNYSMLWSARFTLWSELKVIKTVSQLRDEARRKRLELTGLANPEATFSSDVSNYKEDTANLTPILAGPLVNDVHRKSVPAEVYSQLRDPEAKSRVEAEVRELKKAQ